MQISHRRGQSSCRHFWKPLRQTLILAQIYTGGDALESDNVLVSIIVVEPGPQQLVGIISKGLQAHVGRGLVGQTRPTVPTRRPLDDIRGAAVHVDPEVLVPQTDGCHFKPSTEYLVCPEKS